MENENNIRKRKSKKKEKKYEELKHSQRSKRNRKIENAFREVTNILHPEILEVKVMLKYESGRTMSFTPRQPENDGFLMWEKDEHEKNRVARNFMAVKDKYRISDEAFHELHMIGKVIPSKNQIQDEKKRMNTVIPIFPHTNQLLDCSTRKLGDILDYVLKQPQYEDLMKKEGDVDLMLRFSCDGAKITKKINSVRGVVKIMTNREKLPANTEQLSMSPEDEITLFFFIGDESRQNMEKFAASTLRDMKTASESGLDVQGKKVNIKWIMACDWKAAAILRGINVSRCDFFCLWCYCRKGQICDFSIPSWQIQRSAVDQDNDYSTKNRGYILPDLCKFIPYTALVPDDLHLRIRISLKLFNQVVTWAIDQKKEKELKKELTRIGISFHFWEERGDDKSTLSVKKWSQPSGDDLRIIIKQLQVHNILERKEDRRFVSPEGLTIEQLRDELAERDLSTKGKKGALVARLVEVIGSGKKVVKKPNRSRLAVSYSYESDDDEIGLNIDGIQQLWSDFDQLMEALGSLPSSEKYKEPNTFKELARTWAQDFRKNTFDEDVTPYIHAMVYHVPDFLEKYKFLHDIGVSQVERKNYDHRQAYFGSTNRNGGRHRRKISLQILERENRLLYYKLDCGERKKRKYKRKRAYEES